MNHLSLFSGIGGFDLAAEWAGFNNIMQCEIDAFCLKVLAKNFPDTPRHNDIRTLTKEIINAPIDIISGGFPCQPFSVAGKRKGKEDNRHLWPEMFRIISEVKPTWVIGENVIGFINMALEQTYIDLESQGYEVQTLIIPACAVDAPHRRDRVWIIAYSHHNGLLKTEERQSYSKRNDSNTPRTQTIKQFKGCDISGIITHSNSKRSEGFGKKSIHRQPSFSWCENIRRVKDFRGRQDIPEPLICRNDNGFSLRVDRLKSIGNSIVPQVVYEIFKVIKEQANG